MLIGFVTGAATWLSSRVIFLRSSDEVVARIVLSWLLAPLVYLGIWSWTSDARTEVLFRGEAPSLILVPIVPFAVVSAIGWWAARPTPSQVVPSAKTSA